MIDYDTTASYETLRTHSERIDRCPGQAGLARAAFPACQTRGRLSMAKNKTKPRTAIYHPPKSGMPYLVVTVSPEGVTATAVESKDEARILASKKTLKVLIEEDEKL